MAASREIELKLEIRPEDIAVLKDHMLLSGVSCIEKHQTSVYFDSADQRLRKAGMTLRVRESEGRHVQTIKMVDGSFFNREEWEMAVGGEGPDLDMIGRTPLADRFGKKAMRSFKPLFETVIDRSEWDIVTGCDAIEMVIDRGRVVAPEGSAPIVEIELELKRGSAVGLFDLARRLNGTIPLRLGVLAKSERGYRLLDGADRGIVKAEPIAFSPEMPSAPGFQAIALACIRHFRLNEPLFTDSRDGAALHQARVALRRLRSAMSLFAPMIADPLLSEARDGVRWISGLLGAARDLDIFVRRRLDSAPISPELWSQILTQREAAFDEAIAALDSERFRALMLLLVQWIEAGEWLERAGEEAISRDRPIGDFASNALDSLWRRLKKRGRHLARIGDEERHRVRITAKKLRYASEFFTSLFDTGKGRARQSAFVAALEDMQEQLGSLNDLATARVLAARIAGNICSDALKRELIEASLGNAHAERGLLLAAGEAAYAGLVKAGPFWR